MTRSLLAITALLFAGVLAAAEPAETGSYDTDKDGALSAEEIAAIADKNVRATLLKLDANADGAVSAEELKAADSE